MIHNFGNFGAKSKCDLASYLIHPIKAYFFAKILAFCNNI